VTTESTAMLDVTGDIRTIEQGVNHLSENFEPLMNALDETAKLHPFIGGEWSLAQVTSRFYAHVFPMRSVVAIAFKVDWAVLFHSFITNADVQRIRSHIRLC
jgi:hypothetical protein